MMRTMECPEARVSLGVYVLGAIDPADRALVDAHVATCRDCRDELAGLAGLPALLARVSPQEAMALAASDIPPPPDMADIVAGIVDEARVPPRELLGTVLDLAAARRRRLLEVGLGVAAALIIAVGVFSGLRLSSSPASSTTASEQTYAGPALGPWQTVTSSAQGVSAAVSYRPMGWGTELAVKVSGIPLGVGCQLWVIGPDGGKTLAGSWVTDDHEGAVSYPASSGQASDGMHGFVITVGKSKSLTLTT